MRFLSSAPHPALWVVQGIFPWCGAARVFATRVVRFTAIVAMGIVAAENKPAKVVING